MSALPEFVEPMLARLGREPFDSEAYSFELKWDGTRALAFVEGGGYRLRNRRNRDQLERYPELDFLGGLGAGLVLDGEIVTLRDGRPSFVDMLTREQSRGPARARALAARRPAHYVVFDLLWQGGQALLDLPLAERRERLAELVLDAQAASPAARERLVLSEGTTGGGRAFFEAVRERDLEGMVAKRLASRYLPGRRTDDWIKVKTTRTLPCAILGYVPEGSGDMKSLVIGTVVDGELRCVGRVGSGWSHALRGELFARLAARRRATPVVPCPVDACWVEPELYCTVSFSEFTADGFLRAPVFVELLDESH